MTIKLVQPGRFGYLIELWCFHRPMLKYGLYLTRENGVWIACDNTTGDCWVAEFASKRQALKWLLRCRA